MKIGRAINRVVGRAYVVVAATILVTAVALDNSFFAHFETAYSYTTPVFPKDLARVLAAFALSDVRFGGWLLPMTLLAVTTAVVLHAGVATARVKLLLAAPQLLVLLFAPVGFAALPHDFVSLARGHLDGEWFHEGWPVIEAFAIWSIVPVVVFLSGAAQLFREKFISAGELIAGANE
jgi:hypothetical protein